MASSIGYYVDSWHADLRIVRLVGSGRKGMHSAARTAFVAGTQRRYPGSWMPWTSGGNSLRLVRCSRCHPETLTAYCLVRIALMLTFRPSLRNSVRGWLTEAHVTVARFTL